MLPSANEETTEEQPKPIRAALINISYDRDDNAARSPFDKYFAWGILSFAVFLSAFQRDAPGVLADQLMGEFHVGGVAIGILGSMFCYVYTAMQIPAGLLADTVGPARTVAIGALTAAIGALLFSSAHTMAAACIARFLVGLGASVAFICALKAQAIWFELAAFVAMSGLLSVIATLGSIAAATPLATAANIFGWRSAFVLSACASFVLSLSLWALSKQHLRHSTTPSLLGDAASTSTKNSSHARRNLNLSLMKASLVQVLRSRQTWLCSITQFGLCGTYIAFTGLWGIPYLMQVYGLNRLNASNAMVCASIAFTMGTFTIGLLSARYCARRKPLLFTAGVVLVSMWLLLALVPPTALPSRLAVAVVICMSLASSVSVLTFAIAKESNPPAAGGLAMALTNSGLLCGGLLQVAMGFILDHGRQGQAAVSDAHIYPTGAYQQGFLAFVAVALTSLAAAFLIQEGDHTEAYER